MKWIVGAIERNSGAQFPELQIWRMNNGIEGSNTFYKVGHSLLNLTEANTTDAAQVFEYSPNPPLKFQEGDILGIYTPWFSLTRSIVYYQNLTGPLNYPQFPVDIAPSTFDPASSAYQYPLVTVSIRKGEECITIPNTVLYKLLSHHHSGSQIQTSAIVKLSRTQSSYLATTVLPSMMTVGGSRRRIATIGAVAGAVVIVAVAVVIVVVVAIAIAVTRKRRGKLAVTTSNTYQDNGQANATASVTDEGFYE